MLLCKDLNSFASPSSVQVLFKISIFNSHLLINLQWFKKNPIQDQNFLNFGYKIFKSLLYENI